MDDRYKECGYPEKNPYNGYNYDAPSEHPNAYKVWLRMHF